MTQDQHHNLRTAALFQVTLARPDLSRHLSTIHKRRKAPVVLSPDEVARFLEAAPGIRSARLATSGPSVAGLLMGISNASLRTLRLATRQDNGSLPLSFELRKTEGQKT
jgi:hypothetical protein